MSIGKVTALSELQSRAFTLSGMPKSERERPTEAFGALLKELRERTRGPKRSVQAVVNTLAKRTPPITTSQGTLSGWEQGYLKEMPSPIILWGLANVYRTSLYGLVAVLNENVQNPGLTLRDARRIMEAHYVGPDPAVAAEVLIEASTSIVNLASRLSGEFEDLASFGRGTQNPDHRRKTRTAREVSPHKPPSD